MAKKSKEYEKGYTLVPTAWLERLIELAEADGTNVQHMKGYVASAEVLIDRGAKISQEQLAELNKLLIKSMP